MMWKLLRELIRVQGFIIRRIVEDRVMSSCSINDLWSHCKYTKRNLYW